MVITKNKCFNPGRFLLAHRGFDSWVDNFWKNFDHHVPGEYNDGNPLVDIEDRDDEYLISANLPGIDEKDINVTLENQSLHISVEKEQEKEEDNKRYVLRERRGLAFERSFSLPTSVDVDAVEASFKKGVLEIHIPKKEEVKPRKIELKD